MRCSRAAARSPRTVNHTDRELRRTFERAADLYDSARPRHPNELFDDLVQIAALEVGDRLLEIGCATGIATRALLQRGFSVVCVGMGPQLAQGARDRMAGLPVEVHVASFEDWNADPGSFDLVYAATAWHWVDPAVRYRKAHQLLRPNGHLAFWSAQHAFPVDFDPFFAEIQAVYAEIGESHPGEWPPPLPEAVPDASAEITASGLFSDVVVRRYAWELEYTAEQYVSLLNTFSGHIAMDAAKTRSSVW